MRASRSPASIFLVALAFISPLIGLPTAVTGITAPHFDYVVIIVLENRSINQTYACTGGGNCTYFAQLANQFGLAEGYSAVIHDSLPNYLALTSAWTQRLNGTLGDCSPLPTSMQYCPTRNPSLNLVFPFKSPTIVDRLESAGLTWKAYMEDLPTSCSYQNSNQCSSGNCYLGYGGPSGKYDNEHDPFVYYDDITNNTNRCSKIVPANSSGSGYPDDRLISDLGSTSSASNLIWLTPNVCDDMHDTCSGPNYQTDNGACPSSSVAQCVTQGNAYLATLVPQILSSSIFTTQKAALVITSDEGQGKYPADYVTTIWAGPVAKTNYKSSVQYSHYSFLKTIEDNWGLQALNQTTDGQASSMSEFLAPPPTTNNQTGLPLTIIIAAAAILAIAVIVSIVVIKNRSPHKSNGASQTPAPQPS